MRKRTTGAARLADVARLLFILAALGWPRGEAIANERPGSVTVFIGNTFCFQNKDWTDILDESFQYGFITHLETPAGERIDSVLTVLRGNQLQSISQGGSFNAQPAALYIPWEKIRILENGEQAVFYLWDEVSEGAPEDWTLPEETVALVDRQGHVTLSANKRLHEYSGSSSGVSRSASTNAGTSVPANASSDDIVELNPEDSPLGVFDRDAEKEKRDVWIIAMLICLAIACVVVRMTLILAQKQNTK
ncbi:MAG: hypothetical protein LBT44_09210 [Clostridiales bacterium]|jgi:hypothetical protein|nr:hypothetical protein [Clostridiales bacterium]